VETILRVAKRYHNSYGFTFVGFVSMETALAFDPKCFIKITVFLTELYLLLLFFSKAYGGVPQFLVEKLCI
jgi:hypothetical protein